MTTISASLSSIDRLRGTSSRLTPTPSAVFSYWIGDRGSWALSPNTEGGKGIYGTALTIFVVGMFERHRHLSARLD